MSEVAPAAARGRQSIYRHSVIVRITHWINVVCILFLVMSGLQIFNAHPELDFGHKSSFDSKLLEMTAVRNPDGSASGITRVLGHEFDTTGFLGLSLYNGSWTVRGFPAWLTVPSYQDLATGRRWHFFFAWLFVINGAIYLIANLVNRHIWRDLVPSRRDLGHVGRTALDHIRLRFDHGRDYNVLQKLTYLAMVVVVLPLIVLAGLAMSPGMDSAFPWLIEIFGGRQGARTIHFICATLIVLFVLVHIVMVLISGVWNNIRSMITGRYVVRRPLEESHGS